MLVRKKSLARDRSPSSSPAKTTPAETTPALEQPVSAPVIVPVSDIEAKVSEFRTRLEGRGARLSGFPD